MAGIRNGFVGMTSRNVPHPLCSQFGYELLDGDPRLLDDVMQGAAWQGLAAVDRNADRPNRRAFVKQDVVTSANAVDLEAEPQQGAHGLLSGHRRQSLWAHSQAAMVR